MAYIQQQTPMPLMNHNLLEAATNGNAREVIALLNAAQPAEPTTGHIAIISIPDQGVTSDWDGVLHIAARRGHLDLVNNIPERWGVIDVAAKNKRGETALHCAAASGNVEIISQLISMARDTQNKRNLLRMQKHNGETCLHDAVRFGKEDVVRTLVQQDMKVILGPNDGRALVKIVDKQGVSPLFLATTLRQVEIVRFLTEQLGPPGTYPTASYDGPGGKTALHAAVLLDKDLSERLANWNNKELIGKADVFGNTPLHLLASTKDKIIVKRLLYLDASVGYQADNEGSLPIHVAAANGSLGILKLLSGLCPGCAWSCNNLGQTILHIAIQKRRYYVIKYVCSEDKFSRIFNTSDTNGNTALHLAVLQGNQFMFCLLLRTRKVYLSVTNKEARTPLDLAQLSLPPAGLSLHPSPRQWIMYDLILAGADYGTWRRDQFEKNLAVPDKEKESKSISKSASLVGLCAVLILTIAFAAPFTMTKFYGGSVDSSQHGSISRAFVYRIPPNQGSLSRAFAYRIMMISAAMAFAFSAIATSCCTFAGFSFTVDRKTRYMYLALGGVSLRLASLSIIVVFAAGVHLAAVPYGGVWIAVTVCPFGVLVIIPQLVPVFMLLLHARALQLRLGFLTWSHAIFCALPQQRRDRVPVRYRGICSRSLAVLFFIFVVFAFIYYWTIASAMRIK